MLGEPLRHHGEARLQEGAHRTIAVDQLAEKSPRLFRDPFMQEKTILRIELRIGRGLGEPSQFEPLVGEVGDEPTAARIGEEPVDLGGDPLTSLERSLAGRDEERLVGRTVPEPVGKPRGEGVGILLRAVRAMEKKIRRGQHRDIDPAHRLLEAILRREARREKLEVRLDLPVRDLAPEGLRQKCGEQFPRVFHRLRRLHRLEGRLAFLGG